MKTMCRILVLILVLFAVMSLIMGAQSWTRVSTGFPDNCKILSLSKLGNALYAGTDKMGVYCSTNGGNTWTSLPFNDKMAQSQTWTLATAGSYIFAGQRGNGIFRIAAGAGTWERVNNGLQSRMIQKLMTINDTLYCATYGGGVYYSANYGQQWSRLSGGELDDSLCYSMTYNSSTIFLGTAGRNWSADTGVIFRRKRDFSDSWEKINNGLGKNGVHWEGMFALDADDEKVCVGTDDIGLYKSENNGSLWKSVSVLGGDIHSVLIVDSLIFYGTSYAGIYLSTDAGTTWKSDNTGLSFQWTSMPSLVKDFIVNDSFIYCATDIGIFRKKIDIPLKASLSLVSPMDNSVLSPLSDIFSWHEKNTSKVYTVEISHKQDFSSILLDTICSANSIKIPWWNLPGGDYYWRVTSTNGNTLVRSDIRKFTVPMLTAYVKNVDTVCENSTVVLTAQINTNITNKTIEYQWRFNGVPLSDNNHVTGTKTSMLTIHTISSSDTLGLFSLSSRIEDIQSEFVSNSVRININSMTSIVSHPSSTQACMGKAVILTVNAKGNHVVYQWQFNEENITGARDSILRIDSINNQKSGEYRVIITGDCGTETSTSARVTSLEPVVIVTEPPSQMSINAGNQLRINLSAFGESPIFYQWYKNDVLMEGCTAIPFVKDNITSLDSGTYHCIARNSCDSALSKSVKVKVIPTTMVSTNDENSSLISVIPNPTSGRARVNFSAFPSAVYCVKIYDVSGRIIHMVEDVALQNYQTVDISVQDFTSGLYYCIVEIESNRMVVPMLLYNSNN